MITRLTHFISPGSASLGGIADAWGHEARWFSQVLSWLPGRHTELLLDNEGDDALPDLGFSNLTTTVGENDLASIMSMITPYIGVFFVSWLVTILMTPVMRRVALRYNIIDRPDKGRKIHELPVAYLGGGAIFLGWIGGFISSWWTTPHLKEQYQIEAFNSYSIPIILGAIIIVATGLVDDIHKISPRVKIGGQLIAAAMIAHIDVGNVLVTSTLGALGWHDLPDLTFVIAGFQIQIMSLVIYVLGTALIAIFIIGGCNSVNLIDGLDGLSSGVLSIACGGFLVISGMVALEGNDPSNVVRIVLCLSLLGALLGFLPHNFNPATIFMGDSGSLLLGYLCAVAMLLFAKAPSAGPVLVSASLIVFALPIIDTSLSIFRRWVARKPILQGDDQHLHHQIMRAVAKLGFGPRMSIKVTVLTMYILSAMFALFGCLMVSQRWRTILAVLMVLSGFVIVVAYKAGQLDILHAKEGASGASGASGTSRTSGQEDD